MQFGGQDVLSYIPCKKVQDTELSISSFMGKGEWYDTLSKHFY